MAADTLKSLSITNLDAVPIVPNPTGKGANGYLKSISDYSTPTTGGLASTSSIYRLVRLPTNAKIKNITLSSDAALDSNGSPTLTFDVGAYYSDSANDGTAVANQGVLISANCFGAVVAFGAAHENIYALGAYSVANRNLPLWQALNIQVNGLNADPGGFIDVVVAVHAVAATAVSSNLGIEVDYVE